MPNGRFTVKITEVGWKGFLIGIADFDGTYRCGVIGVNFIKPEVLTVLGVITHVSYENMSLIILCEVFPISIFEVWQAYCLQNFSFLIDFKQFGRISTIVVGPKGLV